MTDLSFETTNLYILELDCAAYLKWELINNEPPKEIVGLRELLDRPTPFLSPEVITTED